MGILSRVKNAMLIVLMLLFSSFSMAFSDEEKSVVSFVANKEFGKAQNLLEKMVQKEEPWAEFLLGSYQMDMHIPINSSLGSGIDLITLSAKQGYSQAMNFLANVYKQGSVVSKDLKRSAYWWEESARKGDVLAQQKISEIYKTGQGKQRSIQKHLFWLEKAASNSGIESWCQLGVYLYEGQY
jgi:TPR repeat protein